MTKGSPPTGTIPIPFNVPDFEEEAVHLPENHFLFDSSPSQTHDFFTPRDGQERLRPDVSTLASADFDIDVRSGFLPPNEPLRRLPSEWDAWEDALVEARIARDNGTLSTNWSSKILSMPLISTEKLNTIPLLRRASIVLGFLSHYYIHAQHPARTIIPKALAVPWVDVSDRLGMPPIICYAHVVLWNWKFRDPSIGFRSDNLEMVETFTGTESEQHFYLTSLLVEVRGAYGLRLMSRSLDEAFVGDNLALRRISTYLNDLSKVVNDTSDILANVRSGCDPLEFYYNIRPYWVGGKWTYQGIGQDGQDEEHEYAGASAGQSTVIHAFDAFLGVDHTSESSTKTASASASASTAPSTALSSKMDPQHDHNETFMNKMQFYMPHHHRAFLTHLLSHKPNVRQLVQESTLRKENGNGGLDTTVLNLQKSFNNSLDQLKKLRDVHFRIVYLYIISQSRQQPPQNCRFVDQVSKQEQKQKQKQVDTESAEASLKGTGGSDLVKLLKSTRQRTIEARLD